MFPIIVPMLMSRSRPAPAPVCQHCGKKWPIPESDWTWRDTVILVAGICLFLVLVALLCMFISWTIDRDYAPHQGQHFIPYVVDCLKALWRMAKDLW